MLFIFIALQFHQGSHYLEAAVLNNKYVMLMKQLHTVYLLNGQNNNQQQPLTVICKA